MVTVRNLWFVGQGFAMVFGRCYGVFLANLHFGQGFAKVWFAIQGQQVFRLLTPPPPSQSSALKKNRPPNRTKEKPTAKPDKKKKNRLPNRPKEKPAAKPTWSVLAELLLMSHLSPSISSQDQRCQVPLPKIEPSPLSLSLSFRTTPPTPPTVSPLAALVLLHVRRRLTLDMCYFCTLFIARLLLACFRYVPAGCLPVGVGVGWRRVAVLLFSTLPLISNMTTTTTTTDWAKFAYAILVA